MKIAVAGAGSMGSRFGWQLKHSGADVTLIDSWDKNVEAVRTNGVTAVINGKKENEKMPIYNTNAVADINGNFDLVIIFTKCMGLEKMLKDIQPILSDNTYVMCLLNGLGHEDIIKKYVSEDHIILGVTMLASQMMGPGEIKFEGGGDVEVQGLVGSHKDDIMRIVDVMDKAGLNSKYSSKVKYSIWRKACVNGSMNPTTALLETNNVGFGQSADAKKIVAEIVKEFADVAEHEGIDLDRKEVLNHVLETFSVPHFPSMYQDLVKNHRLTEIDFINGAVARKGDKYGISTPYCHLITELIHCKEKVNNCK